MAAKRITIDIRLTMNGAVKRARCEGYANVDAGFVIGSIENPENLLSRAEQVLLTAFTFTGCPVAAREVGETRNPWRITGGEYAGDRQLQGAGFCANSRIAAWRGEDEIRMDLSIDCAGIIPRLAGVSKPFQEELRQVRRGMLVGDFEIGFVTEFGECTSARARSNYRLDIDVDCAPAWRNITIIDRSDGLSLLQVEQIDLFGDEAVAGADLQHKRAVTCCLPDLSLFPVPAG